MFLKYWRHLMSTLKEQIEELNIQIKLSQQSDTAQNTLKELSEIYERLATPQLELEKTINKYDALKHIPESATFKFKVPENLKNIAIVSNSALNSLAARWKNEGPLIRNGNDLANVASGLIGLNSQFFEQVTSCWEAWIRQLKSTVVIETVLLETQRHIPGLEDTYTSYNNDMKTFILITKSIPDDKSVINQVISLSQRMANSIGRMQFNLPENVSLFFKYLNNPLHLGKAPISMLTPEVISWLQERNIIDQFIVERWSRR